MQKCLSTLLDCHLHRVTGIDCVVFITDLRVQKVISGKQKCEKGKERRNKSGEERWKGARSST